MTTRQLRPAECVAWMGEVMSREKELFQGLEHYVQTLHLKADPLVERGIITMAQASMRATRYGEAVLITRETAELVKFASESYVESADEKMDIDLPPLREAVLFLEEPMPMQAVAGKGGVVIDAITFWDSRCAGNDDSPVQVYICWTRPATAPRLTLDKDASMIAILYITPTTPVANLSKNRAPAYEGEDGFVFDRNAIHIFLQSFWALMQQPIVSETRERPIEPAARKLRKRLASKGEVRVLRLRQRERSAAGVGGAAKRFEYSHQFIVRGFWRNQFWGPKRAYRRRIWVDSYIKGPADKPLVIGKHVYRE